MQGFINKQIFGRPFHYAAVFILLLAGMLSGCTQQNNANSSGTSTPGQNKEKLTVGFSQMENDGPWRIAETNSMKQEAAKRTNRFELIVTDAQKQTAKQVSDVEDLVARGVDAIFLAPREFEGLAPALQAAKEANIPVVLIDREAAGKAGEDYLAFIGSNFIEQGRRAAQWLAKRTNGKASIVELTGTAGSSVANDRKQGFADELKQHAGMQVIARQDGDFSRAAGQRVMENIIQSKGNQITAVYTHNDEMALGAIQALKAAGRKPGEDVIVVSVDGQKSALEAIMRGELGATVESNPRFGPIAFDTFEKHLRKEHVPAKIILEDRLFDSTNAAQFLNEAY